MIESPVLGGGRLIHISVAVSDTTSWAAHVAAPADWAFGLPVASPARLLWAADEWRDKLDAREIRQPAAEPELEDLVADLGKVAGGVAAGDDLGARFAATDLARLCPSVLRLANPPSPWPGAARHSTPHSASRSPRRAIARTC